MLGEDTGVPENLEVLEDRSAVGCLVRGAEELPDIVHPDGGGVILDELLECIRHRGRPLCDQGLVLAALGLLLSLGGDDELALLVEPQEASGGEVVDLDAGEALGVLVGGGESSGENVRHGWFTFRLGLVGKSVGILPTLLLYQTYISNTRNILFGMPSGWGGECPSPRLYYLNSISSPLHGGEETNDVQSTLKMSIISMSTHFGDFHVPYCSHHLLRPGWLL